MFQFKNAHDRNRSLNKIGGLLEWSLLREHSVAESAYLNSVFCIIIGGVFIAASLFGILSYSRGLIAFHTCWNRNKSRRTELTTNNYSSHL